MTQKMFDVRWAMGDVKASRAAVFTSPIAHRTSNIGFTLLEVILALIVLSTIALAVFGSLRVVFTARDSAEAALRQSRELSTTATLLRIDLEAAVEPGNEMFSQFVGGDESLVAESTSDTTLNITASMGSGGSDAMLFQSASGSAEIRFDHTTVDTLGEFNLRDDEAQIEDQPVAADVHEIEYALAADEANPDQMNLVRRVRKNLLAETREELPAEQIVLRNVASFDLRFFDGVTWNETWDSATLDNAMPLAVEMVLETADAPPQRLVQVYRLTMATASQEGVRITR